MNNGLEQYEKALEESGKPDADKIFMYSVLAALLDIQDTNRKILEALTMESPEEPVEEEDPEILPATKTQSVYWTCDACNSHYQTSVKFSTCTNCGAPRP